MCRDSERLTASHSLEAGEGKSSQVPGQGAEALGAWWCNLFAVSLAGRPVERAVWGKWGSHTFLTPSLSQSPALKTQGKLNTRPGKVGSWGQVEAGRGQCLRTGPEDTCSALSGDPLLRAGLPGQRQGSLGRRCRCLSLGLCCFHKGDTRLVSRGVPREGGPGCDPGVRKVVSP